MATLHEAMKLQTSGKLAEALALYEKVLAAEPENVDATHLKGLALAEMDRDEEGVQLIEKAISKKPDVAAFHHNLAGIYRRMGRLDDAIASFSKAISLKPDYGEAHQGLAEMRKFAPGDPFIDKVHEQLDSGGLDRRMECYFNFAAGKYYDDVQDFEKAFKHYQLGNKAANRQFDNGKFHQQTKDILYYCNSNFVRSIQEVGDPSRRPIFVVGMPRSGTTLVEQILASHSEIEGVGELNEMKIIANNAVRFASEPYPQLFKKIDPGAYKRLGENYLKLVERYLENPETRFVDKHPLNFIFVGLIFAIFPNARVIHTVRHPLDTCLSCFFQNFTKGQDYSFDLMSLGQFFNDYRRMMEHWRMIFGDRIHTVIYESMLEDQAAETRKLLAYCDLSFEPQCLEFHKTDRVVKTASFAQVRQPLYQSSKARWKHYSPWLSELAELIDMKIKVSKPVTISRF